ncbi:MAG: peptidoglycan-binding protein, partial [Microcystaceae cyanobacterium]
MTTLKQVIEQNKVIPYGDIASSPLATDKELCREIQEHLAVNGYYRSTIDGIYGPITREALRDFKEEKALTGGDLLGATTAKWLLKEDGKLPPYFELGRDNLVCAVIKEGRKHGLTLQTQIAYVMATVQHETANTYKPVREAFQLSENWRRQNLWYYPYYGRGYVQLTHKYNYEKYKKILGIDLVSYPDKALDRQVALFILCHGMANGTYTGRRLGQYVNVNKTDFPNARRVVNGEDKKHHIANLANQ